MLIRKRVKQSCAGCEYLDAEYFCSKPYDDKKCTLVNKNGKLLFYIFVKKEEKK